MRAQLRDQLFEPVSAFFYSRKPVVYMHRIQDPGQQTFRGSRSKFTELRAHGNKVHVREETAPGAAYAEAIGIVKEFFHLD
jgi:hypothetical protein